MKNITYLFFLVILISSTQSSAQQLGRTFGAHAFQCDDGTGTGKTLTWDVNAPLDQSYRLHWPTSAPSANASYCAVDASGNMWWEEYPALPLLDEGNIWYGNNLGVATQLPPGPSGSFLKINDLGMPEWIIGIPSLITFSASQITSGAIQPDVTITVDNGGSIVPVNGGIVAANQLTGAGAGKYSGAIPIPQTAPSLDIAYAGIINASIVIISINDPNASQFTVIASVTNINPGVGFTVTFTAPYPNPAGTLNYTVVNP